MSILKNRYKDISFSTAFKYLHVIKQGKWTSTDSVGSVTIPIPDGYTNVFYRVFQRSTDWDGRIEPVGGYYNTGTEATLIPAGLQIRRFTGGGGDGYVPNYEFFYYIYGGDYSDD